MFYPEFWISVQNKILNKKALATSSLCDYEISTVVGTKKKYRLELNVEYWMRVACIVFVFVFYCAFVKSIQGIAYGYWTCHSIIYKDSKYKNIKIIIEEIQLLKWENDLTVRNTILKRDTVTKRNNIVQNK
jgi:hypothetical protein